VAPEDRGVLTEARALEAAEETEEAALEAEEATELPAAAAPEEELPPAAAASEELHDVVVPCWTVIWSE